MLDNDAAMNVKLRFHSLFDLWQFKQTVQARTVEILTGEQVLIGDFKEADIELAQCGFEAEVMITDATHRMNAPKPY